LELSYPSFPLFISSQTNPFTLKSGGAEWKKFKEELNRWNKLGIMPSQTFIWERATRIMAGLILIEPYSWPTTYAGSFKREEWLSFVKIWNSKNQKKGKKNQRKIFNLRYLQRFIKLLLYIGWNNCCRSISNLRPNLFNPNNMWS